MGSEVELESNIRIRSVHALWKELEQLEKPLTVSLAKVEEFDGAGMQLIIHLLNMNKAEPDRYIISGLKNPLLEKLEHYGYRPFNKKE